MDEMIVAAKSGLRVDITTVSKENCIKRWREHLLNIKMHLIYKRYTCAQLA